MGPMDWDDLRYFCVLAEKGSVRAAAQHLGVNPSTVSRRLQAFEEDLGVRLLEKLSEGYGLTAEGERVLGVAQQTAEGVQSLERELLGKDTRLSGEIRVTMPDAVAICLVNQDLADFSRLYPEIDLEIATSYEFLSLTKREADVAIRLTETPTEAAIARRVGRCAMAAYASTDYLRRHDPEEEPSKCRWIGWESDERFPQWVLESDYPEIPAHGRVDNAVLQLHAAKAGMGIVALPCFMGDPEPGLRRLSRSKPKLSPKGIWLLTHRDLRKTARIRTFLDFMADAIGKHRARLLGREPQEAQAPTHAQ